MRSLLALVAVLVSSLPSLAATVIPLQGQTLLNRGNGFEQVQGPAQAAVGAKVVANPGGQGQITYEDGCTVPIVPGQIYTIQAASPCQSSAQPGLSGYAIGAALIGGTVAGVVLLSASP